MLYFLDSPSCELLFVSISDSVASIETLLEKLPCSAVFCQSCLATMITALRLVYFGWFRHSVELLKKGIIWRVGDGVNLNMWFDSWIPRDMSRRPITPRGAVLLRDVSELIDPVIGEWDVVLVRNIFWEEDARIILSIPVHAGMENRVAWHFEMKGAFSVKSAYKVFRKEQITHSRKDGALGYTPDQRLESVWRKIWDV